MAVYVDDMHLSELGQYRGMKMCHMIADSDEELHAMADRIGVARHYFQAPPKIRHAHHRHYDIAMSKRALAIKAGAIPITMRQLGLMTRQRLETGQLGKPEPVKGSQDQLFPAIETPACRP
jgi:hypothetical protein